MTRDVSWLSSPSSVSWPYSTLGLWIFFSPSSIVRRSCRLMMTAQCFYNRTLASWWSLICSTPAQTSCCIVYVVHISDVNWWPCFEHVSGLWRVVCMKYVVVTRSFAVDRPDKSIACLIMPQYQERKIQAVLTDLRSIWIFNHRHGCWRMAVSAVSSISIDEHLSLYESSRPASRTVNLVNGKRCFLYVLAHWHREQMLRDQANVWNDLSSVYFTPRERGEQHLLFSLYYWSLWIFPVSIKRSTYWIPTHRIRASRSRESS